MQSCIGNLTSSVLHSGKQERDYRKTGEGFAENKRGISE